MIDMKKTFTDEKSKGESGLDPLVAIAWRSREEENLHGKLLGPTLHAKNSFGSRCHVKQREREREREREKLEDWNILNVI